VVKHGTELTDAMYQSGCVEVGIGIESGSDRILDLIDKGENTDTIKNGIGMLRKSGIRVKGFFIVGLPGEHRDSINETREFIRDVPLDAADFTLYQPYKGSPIWDNKEKYDIDWNEAAPGQRFYKGQPGQYTSTVRTSFYTSEQLIILRDYLEREFKCPLSR
jgi:radical SAM superfamily enzyme YgiQ (UPF0313 family)